ncbi:MAG TPA: GGDEF domain-containing protein, partial [Nitrospiria bacterium]|nr:GGDEF domain-containing protein [Nitrospiria bacterium]
ESIAGHRFKALPASKKVTISIGIAALPDPNFIKKDDLIRCADLALYRAKKNGRNRIETASGDELAEQP